MVLTVIYVHKRSIVYRSMVTSTAERMVERRGIFNGYVFVWTSNN